MYLMRLIGPVAAWAMVVVIGCGAPVTTDFPNALTAPNGEAILLDDVESILSDTELSDDEKRQELRELGIEDEKLIDALLMG